jgi:UDP-glucuronate 4-epimerase
MATLITGGAGFVGSNIARKLLAKGEEVILLDNFDTYYDPALKRARVRNIKDAVLEEADIRDTDALARIFDKYSIKRIANMAAMPGVRYSVGRTKLYLDVNTTGVVNLMNEAIDHDVEVFVQASTSSIYGQTSNVPFREEDAADRPLAAYPASKRASELFAHSYHNLHGLNVTCLRFFNVYGPMGRPDMMPMRALEMLVNGEEITLWGDGLIKRDWTYIDDTVDGVIAALERPLGYEVINLGFGDTTSIIEFVNIYEELTGLSANIKFAPAPPTEPLITYCDNTRARELLDFDPQTKLAEGLKAIWKWYCEEYGVSR